MYCDQCGAELEQGTKFCSRCGTSFYGNPAAETHETPRPTLQSPPQSQIKPQEIPAKLVATAPSAQAPRTVSAGKASPTDVISHWSTLIEGLRASPLEFYNSVESAVAKRQIPDISVCRVDWKEGGAFSARREYLRIQRKDHLFDICGAPFGSGFFVSWWLAEAPKGCGCGCLMLFALIPLIGAIFQAFMDPETYYKIDTALMFRAAVHGAVQDVIDDMTKRQGLRALSELERKPILREFFK